MNNVIENIGNRIRMARKKQKLTLEALAAKSDLDWSFLARIETGKAVPSIQSLVKISKALNLQLGNLFSTASLPSQDKLFEREILSLVQNLPPSNKERILKILKLILQEEKLK